MTMGAPQNASPPSANEEPPAMLVLGDSVTWGQGLDDYDKFYRLAFDRLSYKYPGLQEPVMLAHSGAVIGKGINQSWPSWPGEIPTPGPTIFDQVNQCANPSSVRVILMNGGINDVNLRVILNPTTQSSELERLIQQYCHGDMMALLKRVAAKFSHPECKIILLGYYPILAEGADNESIARLLSARGVPNGELMLRGVAGISDPRDLAVQFWQQSDTNLRAAVADVRDGRITFVASPFQKQNALFESDPWLWGPGPDLGPQDQVADQRRPVCVNLVHDWFDCQTCIRASIGHPNAMGAIKYAEAIMTAFP
jgi:hypothetical protein